MAFLVSFSELCDWAILLAHGTVANVIIETFLGGDLRSSIWAEVAAFWGINTCLLTLHNCTVGNFLIIL